MLLPDLVCAAYPPDRYLRGCVPRIRAGRADLDRFHHGERHRGEQLRRYQIFSANVVDDDNDAKIATDLAGQATPCATPRCLCEAANVVSVPVIGMGGIASAEDAIEMILAGASAVSVGTANFFDPAVTMKIVDGIESYMKQHGFESVADMVGIVK